jgi:acyl carrier protein
LPRRWVVVGGEALRPEVAKTLLEAAKCRVLNHYGPTETTVGVCTFEVTPESLASIEAHGAQTVPIGRPLVNTHAYVVDAWDNDQPIGIPGELCIGGDGVAAGYYKRPELTRDRFIDRNGERLYRTGDRVRRLPDGAIEFLGRADDQVKIRGFRIELAEITFALRSHPGVENGVVLLRETPGQEPRLVAYVVAKQAGYAVSHSDRPTPDKLIEWMSAMLPDYMVPSGVVLLELLPLTANGKLDVGALPSPEGASDATLQFVEPRSDTEKQLAAIWAEVLKQERVGLRDNFLALGGHSLMAIRVLGKISRSFGIRLSLRTLFEAPTVEQLAVLVEDGRASTAASGPTSGISARSRDAYRIATPGTGSTGSGPTGAGGNS